ncbi:PMP-22/EMP/MP20/Claudin family [Nesidiocoris tenuis]|uniref:PMP-22/EMP/MP20/Claudin family n=1 Tax=Nesidiocoris tenuis TaxID=355587 RepID=A0ABN7BEN5_9HEMI|nr:PMP-22/EMP/MP20/Claudin family [Nesidiocoris tenuis]
MAGGQLDCLTVLSPLTAFLSLAIISVAISTNSWLLTEEKMPNPEYNGTGDNEYLSKITISGLWSYCYSNPGEPSLHCLNINYFPHEEYSPDPNDSTMVIPYAVTRSAAFFFIATFLLFWAEFSCIYGLIHRSKRIYTFISGVVFIISGLLMLIGMVMYISVFKAEIGSKLRPRSQVQPPLFTFEYGYSFLLYVSGFVSIETAGTCAVFLYIYWHQNDWGRKTLEMTMMNGHRKLSSSDVLLPDQHIYSSGVLYPCRRHPQYSQPIIGNHIAHVDRASPAQLQRRLYLEQAESEDSQPPTPRQSSSSCVGVCLAPHDAHQRVSSVSSTYYSYPEDAYVPADLELNDHMVRPWDLVREYPRDLPRDLTNHTVSTTADVNSSDELSPQPAMAQDFVSFDLDEVPPLRTPTGSRRSDYETASLRRTTPV